MERNKNDLWKLQKSVKKHIGKERYRHTIGVRYTCAALAMRYGYDITKAEIAGILHDCAKDIAPHIMVDMCRKRGIAVSAAEERNPFLLHAKVGAVLAREKYQVEDEQILNAILYHTTGRANMALLEKIVYIADYIEPGRDKARNLAEVRSLAFEDLDKAVTKVLKDTLLYLENKKSAIDPMTRRAFLFYAGSIEEKEIKGV